MLTQGPLPDPKGKFYISSLLPLSYHPVPSFGKGNHDHCVVTANNGA